MQPHYNPIKVNQMVMDAMPVCNNSRYPIQEFFKNNPPSTPEARFDLNFHPDLKPARIRVYPSSLESFGPLHEFHKCPTLGLSPLSLFILVILILIYLVPNVK